MTLDKPKSIAYHQADGKEIVLTSPTQLPKATSFLWNPRLLLQVNCRGYVMSQHLGPTASKYSYAPNLEAKTFLQPEQPYFAHYPGRFFYIKNEDNNDIFSLPYEPVRSQFDRFEFIAGQSDVQWHIEKDGLAFKITLTVPRDDVVELWDVEIRNQTSRTRKISFYPSFTIGFMSWMNQSAAYDQALGGIIAKCVTPYQKLKEYPSIKKLKDLTFFLHNKVADGWETVREVFEGEGGIHNPDGIRRDTLLKNSSYYETPIGTLQYKLKIEPKHTQTFKFIFGPAKTKTDIAALREKYFSEDQFGLARTQAQDILTRHSGPLKIKTPDTELNSFVNHWLPRQIYYHGETNRMTDDPQTRNYLQDNMGMSYIDSSVAKHSILTALSQQNPDGSMPDGILLHAGATLKYINQIPHTDHCIWLPICLQAYLDETGDYALLDMDVASENDSVSATVFERVTKAVTWLTLNRDHRGLSLIEQGDWCDPMNMVGPEGRGVSAWLTIATIYALKIWGEVSQAHHKKKISRRFLEQAIDITQAAKQHLWDGNWFARGISDDGTHFGVSSDAEGRIFLNPQSWAILADILTDTELNAVLSAIEQELDTPYGPVMLAPAFTRMHEHIGRVTQKFPGSAENGSVYNHAAIFYIFSLYQKGKGELAFKYLRQMLPSFIPHDLIQRGQLPLFIPNYYRGAYKQLPDMAGRSSHLFNTGTVSWYYRCVLEGLFGLKGTKDGIMFKPNFPAHWKSARVSRKFRGANFDVLYERSNKNQISIDGEVIDDIFTDIVQGKTYDVIVQYK